MTARRKITAKQLLVWTTALAVLGKARAAVEVAEEKADEMLARYEKLLEPSTEKRDKGKDVKVGVAGGLGIRVTRYKGRRVFSLKDFEEAGNEVTPEMEAHIHRPDQVRVTWRKLSGPIKPDAVEPVG